MALKLFFHPWKNFINVFCVLFNVYWHFFLWTVFVRCFSITLLFFFSTTHNIGNYLLHAGSVSTQKNVVIMTSLFPRHNCTACETCKETSTFSSSHTTIRTYNIRQCLTVAAHLCPCGLGYMRKISRPVKTHLGAQIWNQLLLDSEEASRSVSLSSFCADQNTMKRWWDWSKTT